MTENDARVIRTKQMIKAAFFELIETVGFEKINIRLLTDKAMINRSTFYLHYTDKYDLLNQIENDTFAGIKSILMSMPANVFKEKGFDESIMVIISRAFEYIKENREFFMLITGSSGFIYKLSEMIKEIIAIKQLRPRIGIPERYAIVIIASIQTGIISEWLKGGMKESPEDLVRIISAILKDVPTNIWS